MKKITMKNIFVFLLTCFFCQTAIAQNRWEFPMVFTDATGSSDTVWFIQKESDKTDDLELYNYAILSPKNDDFIVYLRKSGDTIWKTRTHSFTNDFRNITVMAENYVFPITVSWNENLFNTIVGNYPPIVNAELVNPYSLEHDLEGNWINDYYGWHILGLNTTGPQPPYDANDLYNWSIFNSMFAQTFFPMSVTLERYYSSIQEYDDELHLCIYPNPVKDILNLSLNSSLQNNVEFSIYDMTGNRITGPFNGSETSNHTMVYDISSLSNGCYILKCLLDNKTYYMRFIKTN